MATLDISPTTQDDVGFHRETTHNWNVAGLLFLGDRGVVQGETGWTRVAGITIKGATIDVAHCILTPILTSSGSICKLQIQAEDADNPPAVDSHATFDLIVWTTAKTIWDPVPAFTAESIVQTPSIVDVVQEIADRPSFGDDTFTYYVGDRDELSSNNASRKIWSFDPGRSMVLHIEFTPSGEGPAQGRGHSATRRRFVWFGGS